MKQFKPEEKVIYPRKVITDDDKCGCLCFEHIDDNKFKFEKLSQPELKKLMTFFRKIESLNWREIKADNSLNYEIINKKCLLVSPPSVKLLPIDSNLTSLRVDGKFRVLGWRESVTGKYHIIWFDKKHESYKG